jgi:hypothetical protein
MSKDCILEGGGCRKGTKFVDAIAVLQGYTIP